MGDPKVAWGTYTVCGTPYISYLCGRDRLTGRGGREAAHLIGSTGGSVRWIGIGAKNDLESDPASR